MSEIENAKLGIKEEIVYRDCIHAVRKFHFKFDARESWIHLFAVSV